MRTISSHQAYIKPTTRAVYLQWMAYAGNKFQLKRDVPVTYKHWRTSQIDYGYPVDTATRF
jgi:hypothetical protein